MVPYYAREKIDISIEELTEMSKGDLDNLQSLDEEDTENDTENEDNGPDDEEADGDE